MWRITTGTHPIWSGDGALLFGQRWNPPGFAAIYAGTSFAVSLLEVLVHANRKTPPSGARYVRAVIPETVSRETLDPAAVPGWDDLASVITAQAYGRRWIEEQRSAILLVPSVVTRGLDLNAVVNPRHPDAARIDVGPETPVSLDARLFGP